MSRATSQNKIVMLGDSGVGKTCLVIRLINNTFGSTESTIGASFFQKMVKTEDGDEMTLEIWDTAGAEKYDSLSKFYCRGSIGCIVVYDVTNRSSYENVTKWVRKLKESVGEKENDCFILLIGNKNDLERKIPENDGDELKDRIGAVEYLDVSAKNGNNFENVTKAIIKYSQMISNGKQKGGEGESVNISKGKLTKGGPFDNCCKQ